MSQARSLPAGARSGASPIPTVRVVDAAELDDATIRAADAVRLRQFHRRDGLDPGADHRAFARTLRRCNVTTLIHDAGPKLVGFLAFELRHRTWEGGSGWVYHARFAAIDAEWRGRTGYVSPTLRRILTVMARRPLSPLYIYGTAYKASYVRMTRLWGPLDSSLDTHDERAAGLVRHMIEVEEHANYDPDRGAVRMPTQPRARERARTWKDPRSQSAADHYERTNPHWREGWALPIAVRADPLLLLRRSILGR